MTVPVQHRADEGCIEHAGGAECIPRTADRALADLAEQQHGVVARSQLLSLGMSRRAIGGRLERGLLHPVHAGVYAVGHRLLGKEGRWMAAALAGGPGAVLSHRSAGQLWGLLARSPAQPEITRPGRFRPRPGLRAHRATLPPDEIATANGIPVTSPFRTLLDLAAVLDRSMLAKAFNEIQARGLTDRVSIPALLKRYPGRRGSAALRAMLRDEEVARGVTRSELEDRFVALIESTDLPRPRLNVDVAVRGRFFVADCLWPEHRVIVELDGRGAHSTDRAFEKDRERDRLLLTEGWRVARITWRQLRDDAPAVLADLRRLLRG